MLCTMYELCLQAITIITTLVKSLKDDAVMLLDILPDNDKFASIRELQDDTYYFQDGLYQWLRLFLDKSYHSITVEGLNHLIKILHDNQQNLSSGEFLFVVSIVAMVTMLS